MLQSYLKREPTLEASKEDFSDLDCPFYVYIIKDQIILALLKRLMMVPSSSAFIKP